MSLWGILLVASTCWYADDLQMGISNLTSSFHLKVIHSTAYCIFSSGCSISVLNFLCSKQSKLSIFHICSSSSFSIPHIAEHTLKHLDRKHWYLTFTAIPPKWSWFLFISILSVPLESVPHAVPFSLFTIQIIFMSCLICFNNLAGLPTSSLMSFSLPSRNLPYILSFMSLVLHELVSLWPHFFYPSRLRLSLPAWSFVWLPKYTWLPSELPLHLVETSIVLPAWL